MLGGKQDIGIKSLQNAALYEKVLEIHIYKSKILSSKLCLLWDHTSSVLLAEFHLLITKGKSEDLK